MKYYINKIAGRFAAHAEAKNEFKFKAEDDAIKLLAMLYGDQPGMADTHKHYRLLLSMVSGWMHAVGSMDVTPEYKGTANLTIMERHMGDNHRRMNEPMFYHMLLAAFEPVTIKGWKRWALREDLSDVYVRFNDELKKAGKKSCVGGLFGETY